MLRSLIFIGTLLLSGPSLAFDRVVDEDGLIWRDGIGPYAKVSFLIVSSTSSYADALEFAQEASQALKLPLDLRGLRYDPKHGLTWPESECAKDPLYPYPCYVARGRTGHGLSISIERSDAYESFRPGLFIVVAGVGNLAELKLPLRDARALVPDAYIKTTDVYVGCMH